MSVVDFVDDELSYLEGYRIAIGIGELENLRNFTREWP